MSLRGEVRPPRKAKLASVAAQPPSLGAAPLAKPSVQVHIHNDCQAVLVSLADRLRIYRSIIIIFVVILLLLFGGVVVCSLVRFCFVFCFSMYYASILIFSFPFFMLLFVRSTFCLIFSRAFF